MKKRTRIAVLILLLIAIGNHVRLYGNENIRTVVLLSVFAIGALSGILIFNLLRPIENKDNEMK